MLRYCLKHGPWKTLVAPMNEQLIKAHSLVKRFLTGICTVFIRKGVSEILLTVFLILPIKDCILLLMNWFSFMVTQALFCFSLLQQQLFGRLGSTPGESSVPFNAFIVSANEAYFKRANIVQQLAIFLTPLYDVIHVFLKDNWECLGNKMPRF